MEWRTWRENATVARGIIAKSAQVSFGTHAPTVRYRFGDLGPNQDAEVREVKLADSEFQVLWED